MAPDCRGLHPGPGSERGSLGHGESPEYDPSGHEKKAAGGRKKGLIIAGKLEKTICAKCQKRKAKKTLLGRKFVKIEKRKFVKNVVLTVCTSNAILVLS